MTPPKIWQQTKKNSGYSEQSGQAGRAPNGESEAPRCTPKVISYLLSDLSNFLSLRIDEYKNGDENIQAELPFAKSWAGLD